MSNLALPGGHCEGPSLDHFPFPDTAAKKLGVAMSDVGFMYLINIPGFKPDDLYEGINSISLKETRRAHKSIVIIVYFL